MQRNKVGTKTNLNYGIHPQTIFHNLYLRKSNGRFSQIDLVVPTKVGILVFEVKDYSGWIFGNGRHNQWTQVLAYGEEKYRFYNPVMQNNNYIAELRKQLGQGDDFPFYSIIVFMEIVNERFQFGILYSIKDSNIFSIFSES